MNMPNLEIDGRISQKFNVISGQSARGPWKKQDFLVEYPDGNFTSKTLFTAFGDNLVAELDKFAVGDQVRVSFNVRAREYNGRWYNDIRAWRISPDQGASAQAPHQQAAPAQPQAPAPSIEDMPEPSSSESEDLPF
jgi:hypothetical protein